MKKIQFICFSIVISIVACGPKVTDNPTIAKNIDTSVATIDSKSNLKSETTEGALTDAQGFKDIGKFKYTVFFDEETKALFKIINVEMLDQTITETYYFEENDLVYMKVSSNTESKTAYVQNGKIVSQNNMTKNEQQLFLDKAERFVIEFIKNHH